MHAITAQGSAVIESREILILQLCALEILESVEIQSQAFDVD